MNTDKSLIQEAAEFVWFENMNLHPFWLLAAPFGEWVLYHTKLIEKAESEPSLSLRHRLHNWLFEGRRKTMLMPKGIIPEDPDHKLGVGDVLYHPKLDIYCDIGVLRQVYIDANHQIAAVPGYTMCCYKNLPSRWSVIREKVFLFRWIDNIKELRELWRTRNDDYDDDYDDE
jgi:hypothetical protein